MCVLCVAEDDIMILYIIYPEPLKFLWKFRLSLTRSQRNILFNPQTCADPRGPTLISFFFLVEKTGDPNTTKSGPSSNSGLVAL